MSVTSTLRTLPRIEQREKKKLSKKYKAAHGGVDFFLRYILLNRHLKIMPLTHLGNHHCKESSIMNFRCGCICLVDY